MLDIEKAKAAGYSDQEIAEYLSSTRNFDVPKHIKAGFTHKEIIDYLGSQKSVVPKRIAPKPVIEPSVSPAKEPPPMAIAPPGLISPNLMIPEARTQAKPSPVTPEIAPELPSQSKVDTLGFPKELIPSHEPVKPTIGGPSAGPSKITPSPTGQVREPHQSELDYFKKNPSVSGMATEDNAVILNPFSNLSEQEKNAVVNNEKARIDMRTSGKGPTFALTEGQKKQFSGYGSDQDVRESIAARILSGDPSAGDVTEDQKRWVNDNLRKKEEVPTLTPHEQVDKSHWPLRQDRTPKGPGFLGTLQRPEGGVSTEISVGVNINGQEVEIPSLVPTLDQTERNYLLSTPLSPEMWETPMGQQIMTKAVEHAKGRMAQGKSPFAQKGEQVTAKAPEKKPSAIAQAGETLKNLATVYGPVEAAANLASQIYGLPPVGLAQLAGLPFGKSQEFGETATKAIVYEPRTEAGRQLAEATSYPFKLLDIAGEKVADVTREKTGSPIVATAVGTAIKAAPLALGLRGPLKSLTKSATNSAWFRSLTIKERGLVTQSLEDMLNRGYPEAEVLRRWNNPSWREEALKRRNKGEEYPPFAEAGKTVEPTGPQVTPPGMASQGPEPIGPMIPTPGTPAVRSTIGIEGESQLALPPGQGFQLRGTRPETIQPKTPVETTEPVGSMIPMGISPIAPSPKLMPIETPPFEAPLPITPVGVGPISPLLPPKTIETPAPVAPIPPIMGMGQAALAQPIAEIPPILEKPAILPPPEPQIEPRGEEPLKRSLPYEEWSNDPALVEDAMAAAKKAGVKPEDLEYAGVQSLRPDKSDAVHLWNVMNPESPLYKSTVVGPRFQEEPAIPPGEEVLKEGLPVSKEGGKEPTSKTSEEVQKAIDDKIDELMSKGMSFEEAQNAPEVEELFRVRDEIDRRDLAEWRKVVLKNTGLPKKEAEEALERLGMGEREGSVLAVAMTAKSLKDWGFDTLINLKGLYDHFAERPKEGRPEWDKERTFADFRWGGIADNPILRGTVTDEAGMPIKWDEQALKKAEAVYNAIAKSQSLEPINLSRMPKGMPGPTEEKPVEKVETKEPLQTSATHTIPPTAQHLELMPEEYPDIEAAAVKQDGKVYKDHTHINIVLENNLDPEKSIPGFVTKQGEFVEQYPKSMEDIYRGIEAIKNTPDINKTKQAHDLGKTLTKDQVKDVWEKYKERIKGLRPEKVSREKGQKWLDISFTDQMYRETVAGYLGEDEMSHAFTPQEIEGRLSEEALAGEKRPLEEFLPKNKKSMIKGKNIPGTMGFDIAQWLNEHGKILTKRNPKTGNLEFPGLDMTALSRREGANKAWGKYTPFAKAGSGKGYTFDILFQELQAEGYTGTIDDALQQLQARLTEGRPRPTDFADFRKGIIEGDPELLRDETINDLTGSLDDEIMGWKEEMREQGISEKDIGRAVEEATRTYQAEGRPPDLETIKKALAESETTPVVKGPPTETAGGPTSQLAPQLKDLGYDDRQIARMRPDVVKEIVGKGLNTDQVSITQDGYLAYITGKNKSILKEPRPIEETILPPRTRKETEIFTPILSPREVTLPGKVPISTQMREISKGESATGDWSKGESRPFAFDPNSTENEGRFRLLPTEIIKKDSYFRRKSRTKGVSYIMGKDKGTGDEVTQAIRFDKSELPEERAAKWWEENKGRFQFYGEEPGSIPAESKSTEKIVEPEKITEELVAPKAQKKYLIDAIDQAIKEAPEYQERVYLSPDYVRLSESGKIQKITPELEEQFKAEGKEIEDYLTYGAEGRKVDLEKTPHIFIEVPGDGDFRVVNSKEALEGFKKLVEERFPGGPIRIGPEAARKLPEKSTGRRISPRDNQEYEYVAEYGPKKVSGSEYVDQGKAYVGQGWFGDGNYIVNGEPPKGFGGKLPKKDLKKENIENVMPSLKDYKEAKYLAEFHLMNSTQNEGLAIHEGMAIGFQPHYMDIVKNRYPDSKVLVKDEESPIIIKQDKDVVGLVMPFKGSGLAEPVKEFLRNERVKFPEEVKVGEVLPETKVGIPETKTEGAIEEVAPELQLSVEGKEGKNEEGKLVDNAVAEIRVSNPLTESKEKGRKGVKISDFGKKIGGARKDLWKEHGLSLEDVKGMTLQERETYTKKAHVWPTIPYETYVKDGMSPGVAILVKKIKDSISTEPELPYSAKADPKLREENFKRYIELVSEIREKLSKVRTLEDIKNLRDELFPVESQGTFHSKYTDQANKDLLLLGGRSLSSALQPSKYDLSRAEGKAEKTGFPAKQEAWQKQYDIRSNVAGEKVYRNGKDVVLDRDEWFVTKKGKYHIEQGDFSSREEAEAWAKDQAKSKGEHLTRPYRENIERTGPDYRKGKNKTGDEILSEFGFHGGEFGNWTNQADRQQALNEAYDGLMDLADTLKVPPKALSLNGELGIAFGARGGGSASAHYEPGRVVMNLTKTRGAGSLAHEWAHAVDDYFGRQVTGGLPGKYVSHGTSKVGEARKEMLDAWGDVMKSISDRVADKEANIATEEKGVKQMTSYINSWLKPVDAFMKENPKANTDTIKDILSMLKGSRPKQWNGENVGPRELAEYLRDELGKSGYKMSKEDVGHIGNNAWHLEKAQVNLAKAEAGELIRTEKTDFLKNAMARAKGKSNNYWARKHELFARAFEGFVEDELNNTGNKSDYLVHSTKESPTSPWGAIYPQGKDRIAINKAFRKWRESLKTKGEGGKMIYATIPLVLPFLMGQGEEDKKRVYPLRAETPSYLPPGLGR